MLFFCPRTSIWNQEVDDFLLNVDTESADGRFHQSAVNADQSFLGLVDKHFAAAEGVDTAVVEETSADEQPQAFYELDYFGLIDHGDIEHAIVGHGIGRLTVTGAGAYADGHHLAVDGIGVDAQFHLVLHAVEQHDEE